MTRKRAVLTVTDLADPSVGQFSSSSTVETPLYTDDMAEDLAAFRDMIIETYSCYSFGLVRAEYCFEIEAKIQAEQAMMEGSGEEDKTNYFSVPGVSKPPKSTK